VGDFIQNFCGLLRISELYNRSLIHNLTNYNIQLTYGWKSIERLEFQSHQLSGELAYMLYNTQITIRGFFSKVLGTLELLMYTSKVSRTLLKKPHLIICPALCKAKFLLLGNLYSKYLQKAKTLVECLASNFRVLRFFPRSFLPVLAWNTTEKNIENFPGSPKYDAKHWVSRIWKIESLALYIYR